MTAKFDSNLAISQATTETPEVPLNLDLELASVCQLRCPFCHFGGTEHLAYLGEKDKDGKPNGRMMPTAIAKNLIRDASNLGIPVLKFNSRGESTLHPDYSEILTYAGGFDFKGLLVNTHGDIPRKSWDGLLYMTKVMISLDSLSPEIHPKMRVGANLENVKELIRWLIKMGHVGVWLRRVKTKLNAYDPFFEDCESLFPGVHVAEHACFDRNETESYSTEPIDKAWPRTYCGQPSWRLTVRANGDIVPCCVTWENELVMGHYPEDSLIDVWRGEKMATLRGQLKAGIFKAEICKNCTSFSAYDRPERNFLKDLEGQKL